MTDEGDREQSEAFPGDSPRWREDREQPESEKDRRAHDREPDEEDKGGAIERNQA